MDDDSELDAGYAGADVAAEKPHEVVEPAALATQEAPPKEEPKPDPLLEIRDLLEKQNTRIRNTDCINTSYPGFARHLDSIRHHRTHPGDFTLPTVSRA